jgi:Pretoxin HINT domain
VAKKIATRDDNICNPSTTRGCFVKGTLVHTREGLRPIEELREGDYVLSSREDGSGEPGYQQVVKTFVHEQKTIRQVIADWGEVGRFEMLAATGNHPFWVKGLGWTRADLLNRKSVLRLADGRAGGVVDQYPVYRTEEPGIGWTQEMADVETSYGNRYDYQNARALPMGGFDDVVTETVLHSDDPFLKVTVYNIEVEDYHTYYVGKTGFWVHNVDCEGVAPFNEGG